MFEKLLVCSQLKDNGHLQFMRACVLLPVAYINLCSTLYDPPESATGDTRENLDFAVKRQNHA